MSRLALLTILISVVPLTPALAQPKAKETPVEAPVVGRPLNFSEAIGNKFLVEMKTSTEELHTGDPLILTIRVTSVGRWWQPPQRPHLVDLPKFKERFLIDLSKNEKPDREKPGKHHVWEFDYRLRPLNESVVRVPPVPFVYFKPAGTPVFPGFFPTTYAHEVPLTVKPPRVPLPASPIEVPERFFRLVEGPEVRQHEGIFRLPSGSVLTALLLILPAFCFAWCVLWQRLYPDAARLARKRQSRAAKEALQVLLLLDTAPVEHRAGRIAAIARDYLRDRLDLRTVEPTPAEVAGHMQRAGVAEELAGKTAEFFRACDAARFAPPTAAAGDNLVEAARRLIQTLEAELWSPAI